MQRILIFLFVNGKCYGTQLHRLLNTPLTPIQKALDRLERGGVIISFYEGKTRLYQFNPAYPLLTELDQLLKKVYTLLPAHEKKNYYAIKEEPFLRTQTPESKAKVLLAFWDKLMKVSQFAFSAKTKSKEESGWNGNGKGEVVVAREGANILIFNEKGSWEGKDVGFSNVYRWTLDRQSGIIALEHLRRGPEHPVFLFHLAPSSKQSLSSIDTHLCGGDIYFGQIQFDRYSLRLNWRVIGPKKNEEISCYYTCQE